MGNNNWRKLVLLLWKNFILQVRRPIGTAIELILPVAFLSLLFIPRNSVQPSERCLSTFSRFNIKSVNPYDPYSLDGHDRRLAYFPITQNTTDLLHPITDSLKLELASTSVINNKSFTSLDEIINDVKEYGDRYLGIITFENMDSGSWEKNTEYSIHLHEPGYFSEWISGQRWHTDQVYPASSWSFYYTPYKGVFLLLQYYVDSAIIQMQTGNESLTASQYTQQFPQPGFIVDSYITMVQMAMPLVFVFAFIYTATMIVKELVAEKQLRLRESMKMMGLPNWIHWLAWFIKSFVFFLITIILQTILMKYLLRYTDALVIFVTLLLYVLAVICSLFLISVFFSNGTRAMIFTTIFWLISYAPLWVFRSPEQFQRLPQEQKYSLCLLPNTCLGVMINIITRYELAEVDLSLSGINKPVNVDQTFLLTDAFFMLAVDCVIFLLFTWYIENVFPGEYGVPQPFYFPFQKSYWFFKTAKVDSCYVGPLPNVEEEPKGVDVGIAIKNLRKVFQSSTGDKAAVDDLNLNIYKGQITALLGHNGAGKTTSLSILTGLFPPTSGIATINGKSILTDMDAIRDSLGLCPQHNILFDRLTVKEHLEFFSALKGVSKVDAKEEITQLIIDMQLGDKTNERSSTLSGGMKRKLSCAIALVGGSETVFLDEPTSGMDPYARRATWDVLQKYRENKTIILTTHHMDEADYLGDRIAIMVDGQVHCCGSSLYLKKRYGVGYHLTLVKSPTFEEERTFSLFKEQVPTAKLVGNVAAELSYVLNEDSTKQFKQLFEKLEDTKDYYGISNFGVSVTTLEEVFLKVGEEASCEKGENNLCMDDLNECISDEEKKPFNNNSPKESYVLTSGIALKASQFKAMFMKRYLNSKRAKKAILTQILIPLVSLLIGFLLMTNLEKSWFNNTPEPPRRLTLSMLKTKGNELVAYYADMSSPPTTKQNVLNKMSNRYYQSVQVQSKDRTINIHNITVGNEGNNVNVLYSKSPYTGDLKNGLQACCGYQYIVLNEKCKNVDKWKGLCNKADSQCFPEPPQYRITTTSMQEYILEESGTEETHYLDRNVAGFTKNDSVFTVWYSNQAYHTLPSAYSAVSNIILKYEMNDEDYEIITNNYPLPPTVKKKKGDYSNDYATTLILCLDVFAIMASCLLAASFISFLVTEKVSKAKHVQFVSGVNSFCYWGATFCWDIINFMVPGIGFLILFAVFDLDGYKGELGTLFVLIVMYGLSILPFVYLLSFLFTSSMVAYAFISTLVMLATMGAYIYVTLLSSVSTGNLVFMLFPTYTFPKALHDVFINTVQRKQCMASAAAMLRCKEAAMHGHPLYQDNVFDWDLPGVGMHCVYMCAVSVVYFMLIILIEENIFGRLIPSQKNVATISGLEDDDVRAERLKISAMQPDDIEDTALTLKDLTKVYMKGGIVAVDHISCEIARGECFGLLGVNGAGKTTTFGMLTGELRISEGTAYLHGLDIKNNLKKVQQFIGYCPQFDALVDNLTGREMLHMFAQLRGVPSHVIDDVVTSAIINLNLHEWADKMCGNYSGGNKRKLSTALALIGNPSVVFLDEPTSGMDPGSRRHLWNTLSDVLESGRSIVLTSHSMEECEALCNRLVIMVNGKFKCIGSVQHLKSRFGQGYIVILKVNTSSNEAVNSNNLSESPEFDAMSDAIKQVKSFMRKKFPKIALLEERQGFLQYHISHSATRLSHIFGIFEENASSLGIVDYSVTQTTLDQVFINFAKEQLSEKVTKRRMCCSCLCSCF